MALGDLLPLIGFGRDSRIRTLGRGIGLAAFVGVVSGAVAVLFHALCLFVAHFAMGLGVGYEEGGPAHESTIEAFGIEPLHAPRIVPWMLLLVPTVGGLVSGLLTWAAPEARGSGTDPAINAYHHKGGFIRRRVPVIKMLASAITLGTGGSGGQEGPIAQMGAGAGSWIATRLGLSDYERRILMTAGLGAGIGALFHAPLAGAIFAIEVLYRDPDFESEALIPAFIATTMAYCVYSLAYGFGGFQPLFFVNHESLRVTQPLLLLPPLTVLAVAMSALSLMFVRTMHGSYAMFGRLRVPAPIKPAIGGLAVGSLALAAYAATTALGPAAQHDALSVLSIGYGFLQEVLADQLPEAHAAAIAVLLVVGFGKLLTTSLTIGSGGAAGSFGPSMVIGGTVGAALALCLHQWVPDLVERDDLVIFAILGMAGFFAATAKTPVSSLIMASEVTNSYALLLPSMWVCALAYLTSRNWTLYREQVNSRLQSPAHRSDFIVDVLRGATVGSAITDAQRRFVTVSLDTPIDQVSRMITGTLQSSFPVVDPEGRYRGLFDLDDVRQFLYESQLSHLAVAEDLADESVEPLTLTTDLSAAMSRFAQEHFDELPVVEHADSTRVLAMLRRQDVLTAYDNRVVEMRG